jgi:hypothetical protein
MTSANATQSPPPAVTVAGSAPAAPAQPTRVPNPPRTGNPHGNLSLGPRSACPQA